MRDITVAITAASYHGNKGAAAMLQSAITQLYKKYGASLTIHLMSVYPDADKNLLPLDFIKVVPSKPERVIFISFPLAVLFRLFRWLPPVCWLLKREKIIRTYAETSIVLDLAGVSFVDSRGFIMNTYAAITMAIPLLLGLPVVKYSQALGSFHSWYNRMLAKLILPRIELICARGEITKKHLAEIGIVENVKICADGAFSMPDDEAVTLEVDKLRASDDFYGKQFVTLSLSSVVEKRCVKLGIDYRRCVVDFINYLTGGGYGVLLIANAARLGTDRARNNDLPICDDIYNSVSDKHMLRWYKEEMGPEKIRELIGHSMMLIGSRFHAMIAALERKTPVLLVGWSHKYKEVLDMFDLGVWAVDYADLSRSMLTEKFEEALAHKEEIERHIAVCLPNVLESSLDNIRSFSQVIDRLVLQRQSKVKTLNFDEPGLYTGDFLSCRMGYAADGQIRENAASGGMVTALLCGLLREGKIDGAWVTRSFVRDGEIVYETFIATSGDDIKNCSGSVYCEAPMIKHINVLSEFSGRIAVVMLPCQMRALNCLVARRPELQNRIALRICLYCSGVCDKQVVLSILKKRRIPLKEVRRIIFRRGHYRGNTIIRKTDGTEQQISYTKNLCAYKNAFFFSKPSCLFCQDHFGREADLSFGDIWLRSMKKNPIKHTSCLIRNETGLAMYNTALKRGDMVDFHFSATRLLLSQKRALVYKYNCAKAKVQYFERQNRKLPLDTHAPCRWNHRLAYALARRNRELSARSPEFVEKIPVWMIYYYMCFIRVLLNF